MDGNAANYFLGTCIVCTWAHRPGVDCRRVAEMKKAGVEWATERQMRWVVVPPKTKRGYESPYREQKIAAHTTVAGKGKIARLPRRRKV